MVAMVLVDELLSAGVREQLCDDLSMDRDQLTGFVGYLVSLHDLGKIEYSFQVKDEEIRQAIESESTLHEVFMPGIRHEKGALHGNLWDVNSLRLGSAEPPPSKREAKHCFAAKRLPL